jgi:hypothetical protein
VEWLKVEAMSSSPSTTKTNKEKQTTERQRDVDQAAFRYSKYFSGITVETSTLPLIVSRLRKPTVQ